MQAPLLTLVIPSWPFSSAFHVRSVHRVPFRTSISPRLALNEAPGSTGSFQKASRRPSLRIFERLWVSTDSPCVGVLLVHGYLMHSGYFGELASSLVSGANAAVLAPEMLGHGRSDRLFGIRGYLEVLEDYSDDVVASAQRLRSRIGPSTPLYVLGESMGAILTIVAALDPRLENEIDGIVLCGAAIRPAQKVLPSAAFAIARVLGRFLPRMLVPLSGISGDTWDEAFGDPEARKLTKEDPLVGYGETARLAVAAQTSKALEIIQRGVENLKVKRLLGIHYRNDTRVEHSAVEELIQNAHNVEEREMFTVDGNAHQLFQDVYEKRVQHIQKVVSFVNAGSVDVKRSS